MLQVQRARGWWRNVYRPSRLLHMGNDASARHGERLFATARLARQLGQCNEALVAELLVLRAEAVAGEGMPLRESFGDVLGNQQAAGLEDGEADGALVLLHRADAEVVVVVHLVLLCEDCA